jgi:hypothetical protein
MFQFSRYQQTFHWEEKASNLYEVALPDKLDSAGRAWKCIQSESIPLGFYADHLTAYPQARHRNNGASVLQHPTDQLELYVRVSRNNTKWSEWFQLLKFGGRDSSLNDVQSPAAEMKSRAEPMQLSVNVDELQAKGSTQIRFAHLRVFYTEGVSLDRIGLTARKNLSKPKKIDSTGLLKERIVSATQPPHYAQFEVPDIGSQICSPTSILSSIQGLEANGSDWTIDTATSRAWDPTHEIYGNWIYAAQLASEGGLHAQLRYTECLIEVAKWVEQDGYVIASVRYEEGELTNSPRNQTGGHLILITGVDAANGKVICCDSAFNSDQPPPHEYLAEEFENIWLNGHSALGYYVMADDT